MRRGAEEMTDIKIVDIVVIGIQLIGLDHHDLESLYGRFRTFALLTGHIIVDEVAGYFVIQVVFDEASLYHFVSEP